MDVIKSVHIFQYIQEFLDSYEYLQLMNTSKVYFQVIKRDTIQYHVTMNNMIGCPQLGYLGQMILLVKDPKKQIYCEINLEQNENNTVSFRDLFSIRLLSSHLYSIEINTNDLNFPNQFDFSIFNNISIVKLYEFFGIYEISNGFENVRELYLSLPTLRRIYGINVTKTLRKLQFLDCSRLKSFPDGSVLHDVEQLLLTTASANLMVFQSMNNDTALDMTKLFSRFLLEVQLKGDFAHDIVELIDENSSLFHIPNLTLIHKKNSATDDGNEFVPALLKISFFSGKHLKLDGFDLSNWDFEKELPELLSFRLISCTNFNQLPVMPNLHRLKLERMEGVKYIPTFTNLNDLALIDIPTIEKIDKQPNLKYFTLVFCEKLSNFDMFDGQFFRSVAMCGNEFKDASPFRNSCKLSLSKCFNVASIRFYDSHIPSPLRSLTLNWIDPPLEFRSFADLKELNLICFSELDLDAIEIRNICDLSICVCNNYHSTENLHEIKERFVLTNCENLTTIRNLQYIPEVVLGELPTLNDISGLGHHQRVIIFNLPFLKRIAKQYAYDRIYGRQHQNPYFDIFRTIESFAMITPSDEEFIFSWEFFDTYELTYFWGDPDPMGGNTYHFAFNGEDEEDEINMEAEDDEDMEVDEEDDTEAGV